MATPIDFSIIAQQIYNKLAYNDDGTIREWIKDYKLNYKREGNNFSTFSLGPLSIHITYNENENRISVYCGALEANGLVFTVYHKGQTINPPEKIRISADRDIETIAKDITRRFLNPLIKDFWPYFIDSYNENVNFHKGTEENIRRTAALLKVAPQVEKNGKLNSIVRTEYNAKIKLPFDPWVQSPDYITVPNRTFTIPNGKFRLLVAIYSNNAVAISDENMTWLKDSYPGMNPEQALNNLIDAIRNKKVAVMSI